MILKSLHIMRGESYSTHPNQYRGECEFVGENGSVKLHLNEETSKKILAVVADQVVASSKEIAQKLTVNCIEAISTDKQLGVDSET